MNSNQLTRLAGMDLSTLAGPWLMDGDRVKSLQAKIMAGIAGGVSLPNASNSIDEDDGYSVVGDVAVIKVIGVLTKYPLPESWMDDWCGFCPTVPIMCALNDAIGDARIKEVVFIIDSPGGMVAGTNELAEAIAVANTAKTCRAIISDCAASGGYYLASQCTSVTCNAMGEVGCIGVYGVLWDQSKWFEALGVVPTLVTSGGVKGLGADGKVTPELIADQQRGVDAMYAKFVADVAKGRAAAGMTPEMAKQVGTGQTWLAAEALGLKLIDAVASTADALNQITTNVSGAITSAVLPAPQAGTHAAKNGTQIAADSGGMEISMDAKKRAYLESVGLRSDATDEQAQAFYALLSPEKQAAADATENGTDDSDTGTGDNTDASATKPAAVASATDTVKSAASDKDRLNAIRAVCDNDKAFAADCYLADMTPDQAKVAYEGVKSAKADAAGKQATIDRMQFEAGGQQPIGTAGANTATATDSTDTTAHEAKAKTEWSANTGNCRNTFIDEPTYIAARKRELAGK